MTIEQQMVREFMLKAGQECPVFCSHEPTEDIKNLRYELIREELEEFDKAQCDCDRIGVADAIGDLLVVVLGAAVSYGFDIQPIFDEIMRSNMSKFIDGYKREDGKWMKGKSWTPPNLEPIIKEQQNSLLR